MGNFIKVSVVEDDSRIRDSLVGILDGVAGFHCVNNYATGEEALDEIPRQKPDVVLMDIKLPGMSGIECVARLKEKLPALPIVMLTVFEDSDKVFKALEAGACGYLVKRTTPEDLLEALRQVHSGGAPMTGRIARMVVQSFGRMGTSKMETENLTPREREILELLAKGDLCKEIAEKLGLSLRTVHTHLKNIYEKLHVRSRTQAVLKYIGRR
jgi:DNA-binding NarL/FixJ family response regulator